MSNEKGAPQPSALLDRGDVRVKHATGIGGAVAAFGGGLAWGRI